MIDGVKARKPDPVRPELPKPGKEESGPPRVLTRDLMVKCWAEEPGLRPNTKEIRRKLREINGGKLVKYHAILRHCVSNLLMRVYTNYMM